MWKSKIKKQQLYINIYFIYNYKYCSFLEYQMYWIWNNNEVNVAIQKSHGNYNNVPFYTTGFLFF